jgi:hypothetical protein
LAESEVVEDSSDGRRVFDDGKEFTASATPSAAQDVHRVSTGEKLCPGQAPFAIMRTRSRRRLLRTAKTASGLADDRFAPLRIRSKNARVIDAVEMRQGDERRESCHEGKRLEDQACRAIRPRPRERQLDLAVIAEPEL